MVSRVRQLILVWTKKICPNRANVWMFTLWRPIMLYLSTCLRTDCCSQMCTYCRHECCTIPQRCANDVLQQVMEIQLARIKVPHSGDECRPRDQ